MSNKVAMCVLCVLSESLVNFAKCYKVLQPDSTIFLHSLGDLVRLSGLCQSVGFAPGITVRLRVIDLYSYIVKDSQ